MKKIDVRMTVPQPEILPFRGTNPRGDTISVNGKYLEFNGKPWYPIMGELHYSRYNENEWAREIRKMKAGGVEIVSSYVFWIHHEEKKGEWDFTGCRDLKRFIEVCREENVFCFLRIGPWPHGECRNGGFPDWLQQEPGIRLRSDDPLYLGYVEKLFDKIGQAARGQLWKDGGPIIGVQIENEYSHTYKSEPDAAKRMKNMLTYKKMAIAAGFDVPLYTATAWGGAACPDMETLPVLGGYVDAPWGRTTAEMPESSNFLLIPCLNDPNIGSDLKLSLSESFTCDIYRYPYMTAELGGGIHSTELRRILVDPRDTAAQALCMLGSGANCLGYYVYHGGTNPDGKYTTLQESKDTGYPSNLTVKSYDFDAILGEFGIPKESYGYTRRMHMLLKTFESEIADSYTVIPEDTCTKPDDFETLRWSARHNVNLDCGFIFINNHLRKRSLKNHTDVEISVRCEAGEIRLPKLHVRDHSMHIIPYNMMLGDARLISTNATPLTRIGSRWFFYTDDAPVYNFEGKAVDIVTLSEADSRRAFKFGDKLYLADCALFEKNGHIYAEATEDCDVTIYGETGDPYVVHLSVGSPSGACTYTELGDGEYMLHPVYPKNGDDMLIEFDYSGDMAEVYEGDKLLSDRFYNGRAYAISLRQVGSPAAPRVKIHPSLPPEERYFDVPAPVGCELRGIKVILVRTLLVE
ncbi:MAG: beta-galactosidase [Clostridia bacterium]|nr:beta-galactosidase [Clostridia bacterium]